MQQESSRPPSLGSARVGYVQLSSSSLRPPAVQLSCQNQRGNNTNSLLRHLPTEEESDGLSLELTVDISPSGYLWSRCTDGIHYLSASIDTRFSERAVKAVSPLKMRNR